MKTAVFTGTFDPFTEGHLDVARRAAKIFDKLYVVVFVNHDKTPMFSVGERMEKIRQMTKDIDNVEVSSYNKYVVEFCAEFGVDYIVRGIRSDSDYVYESEMAAYNFSHGGYETVYFAAPESLREVSSTKERQKIAKCDIKD